MDGTSVETPPTVWKKLSRKEKFCVACLNTAMLGQ